MSNWHKDWALITHVVDSHTTFKVLSVPNSETRKVFVFEINDTLDPQLKDLLEITESLLFELEELEKGE
jgi:hypothetical protein